MAQLKLFQKLLIIGASCCVISLPAYLFLFGKKNLPSRLLTTLEQKTPTINSLSPRFFSNYLGLKPGGHSLNIQKLDINKISSKLKQFPIFKQIDAEFTSQGSLLVSYELRTPIYRLNDFSNCGVDVEGRLMPLVPFYSPKNLPFLYLGLDDVKWEQSQSVDFANQIVDFFNQNGLDRLEIIMIDLSRLKSPLKSHREVIVTVRFLDKIHYLRINANFLNKALSRYASLFKEPKLKDKLFDHCVFDARIMKFATLRVVKQPAKS